MLFIKLTLAHDASPIILNVNDIAFAAVSGEHTEITDFQGEACTVLESVDDVFEMLKQA